MKNPTKNLSASTQLKLGAKAVRNPNQVRKNDDQNIIGLLPYLSAINPQNADESIIPKNVKKKNIKHDWKIFSLNAADKRWRNTFLIESSLLW